MICSEDLYVSQRQALRVRMMSEGSTALRVPCSLSQKSLKPSCYMTTILVFPSYGFSASSLRQHLQWKGREMV
jgi:hypothetical protein